MRNNQPKTALRMRSLIWGLMLLTFSSCGQQSEAPTVAKTETLSRTFHGMIDTQYPITVHLNFGTYAHYHMAAYSVTGWYYYDRIKTEIPLVGIYTANSLVLYVFEDQAKRDLVANM